MKGYKQNETAPTPKKVLALSGDGAWRTRCDAPVIWWGCNLAIGFLDKMCCFFTLVLFIFFIYGCLCFVGNVAVSVWLASVWLIISVWLPTVWQLSVWMLISYWLYGPSVWLSSVLQHINVWLLTMMNNQCECLALSMYVWQSDALTFKANSHFLAFFLSITQILFLLYFSSAQINHLYDV